jgi:XTP/dITP diphosphohydrolase
VRLLLATHNEHKRRELERMFAGLPAQKLQLDVLPRDFELPPENGETFAENALGKARAAASGLGRPTIADDSGIAAAALGGAPGVRSARYAGEHASDEENLRKLIEQAPVASELEYVCVIAYVEPVAGVERLFEGRCKGTMAPAPRGERGFGYDPVFLPDQDTSGRTLAELTDAEKDAISHRGRAARDLAAWLSA